MNYFAHGMPFVDEPYMLAGTAVPDWLSVADRSVRLRPRLVEPFVGKDDAIQSQVATGVLRHFSDDDGFHRSRAFFDISGAMTGQFRAVLDPEDGFRCSFLGHITTELLLDGVLIDRHPARIDDYYAAVRSVDPARVQQAVNTMARKSTTRLATFIENFLREEFLRDYGDDKRLLFRLNQVMHRVRLPPLPETSLPMFEAGRDLIRARVDELAPQTIADDHFGNS